MVQHFAVSITVAFLLMAGHDPARAQGYPEKPVRIIVPFAAGGGADMVGRAVASPLSSVLGQPVIVENRAGADGSIGASAVAKAAPDGYTLLVGTTGPMVIAPALVKPPYDTLRDFAPVTQLITQPIALVVHPSLPAKNVREFITLAKARPGQLTYGSAGVGNGTHLAAELFRSITKIDMIHVPYKGTGPAVIDLLGGHIQVIFSSIGVMLTHLNAGRLKPLAVGSEKRMPMLPDVPTMLEAGVKGFDISSWYGLFAPAATPPAITERLSREVASILHRPEMQKLLVAQGAQPVGSSTEAFTAHIKTELARWREAVRAAGIKAE